MIPHKRVDVLGVHISAINMSMAVEEITRLIDTGEQGYVCVTGVHGVIESQADADLRRIHNESALTTPDGMPIVWSGWWAGASWMDRVYGPDLMLALCGEAVRRGWKMFFYGGRTGVPEMLTERLESRFPGLDVVGSYSPPFRELTAGEDQELVSMIGALSPDIVWVGLSTPKQERWMAAHLDILDVPVMIGVGAAFDIHAGLVSQAPRWIQRSGLEWLWRLSREPRRLWRRYLRSNPRFVAGVVRSRPKLVGSSVTSR